MQCRTIVLGLLLGPGGFGIYRSDALGAAPAWEAAVAHGRGFQLSAGLQLDVWAAEPQLSNGVAFSFDGQGRCYVAETHRYGRSIFDITQKTNWLANDLAFRSVADRSAFLESTFNALQPELLTRESEVVRMLEDRDASGRVTHSEIFADGFNSPADGTAAGVLAGAGSVWFGNIPHLWRISSTVGGDSRSRPRESVAYGFGVHVGVTGHDLHGLIRGPDGRIYFSFGDRGVDPSTLKGLAPIPAHVAQTLRDTGGVMRCEPDGSHLELFCFGLRNPQELAFDDAGNLWTVDNDTAGADDCRVLHLVEGGDYGWRCSYQHMVGFGPWVQENLWRGGRDGILPLAGTVSQGPSGLAFYPGTGFGDRLAGRFLHCDFPAGIWSFSVKPRGCSFAVDTREKFLWNCWATDVDFGPDGSVYVLDWVNGWEMPQKGRIYRISDPVGRQDPVVAEVRKLLAAGFKQHGDDELLGLLSHTDRRVRLEAQWELSGRGPGSVARLRELAVSGTSAFARQHAIWGIGQALRLRPRGTSAEDLARLEPLLNDPDPEIRGQVALLFSGLGCSGVADAVFRGLVDASPRARLLWAVSAARLSGGVTLASVGGEASARLWPKEVPRFPEAEVFQLMTTGKESDSFSEHFAAEMLARRWSVDAGVAWQRVARHPEKSVRMLALLAARRLGRSEVAQFLRDAEPDLVEAAGRAIHDVPVASEFARLAQVLLRVDCPAGLYSRAVDAAFRLGSAQHATLLANFASRRDVPAPARARAIDALADWASPSPIDSINGLWHPLVSLGVAPAPAGGADPDRGAGVRSLIQQASVPIPGPASRFEEMAVLPGDLGRLTPFDEGVAVKRRDITAKKAFLGKASELVASGEPDLQRAVIRAVVRLRIKEAATPLFELFAATTTASVVRSELIPALAALNAAQTGEAVRLALADPDPAVQASAIPHLARLEGDETVSLLGGFVRAGTNAVSREAAQVAYGALGQLRVPAADALLQKALEELVAGLLPVEMRLDVLMAAEERSAAVPVLRDLLDRYRAQRRTDDTLAPYREALAGGSAARGRAIFVNHPGAQCLRCHTVSRNGGTVGPALDGIGKTKSPEYLLESVVFPNRAFATGYQPAPGGMSAMPDGLAEGLTRAELRDLIAFLVSLK